MSRSERRRASWVVVLATALSLGTAAPSATAAAAPCPDAGAQPWCNRSLSPDARAGILLRALSQDEKMTLLSGGSAGVHTGATQPIDRVGLPPAYVTDGPVGVRQGSATAMPTPMADAATFDPSLAFLYGKTVGNEARLKGNDGVLAPTVNMMRTPLNGRTFEAFGEDPILVARTTASWIEGAQSEGVFATVKHFAANNQEGEDETGATAGPGGFIGGGQQDTRYVENSIVDERTLREIYLPQFEAAVKEAHTGAVMCSYNRLNSDWACANQHLIGDVLKHEWGYRNLVMSDWVFASHHAETAKHLNGGMDLEMPFPQAYTPALVGASLATGQSNQAALDDHVRRILRTLFAFGFFDRPAYANDDSQIDKAGHAQDAQRIEESAITLLENRGALPLDTGKLKSLAVIGPYADKFVTGGGSGNVTPLESVTALQGIKARAGSGVTVTSDDGSDAARAAGVARAADAAVVFVGDYETEGADRRCLSLECPDQGDQDGLIDAVAAAQPNTIVVLETGGPVLTPWRDKVAALVEAWYPGEQGGAAIARMLFGDVDPGGRLPVTFPQQEGDLPAAGDPEKYPGDAQQNVRYKEGVLVGYRWYDAKGITPAYPFGFGLSYTSFAYRNLAVSAAGDGATVSFDVTNAGSRAGTDVPQLYLGLPQPAADVVQPPRQLKGFQRVTLDPGETKRVTVRVDQRALSYWDVDSDGWQVAPGCYGVMVGRSSRDIVQRATLAVGGASCPGAAASVRAPKACASRRSVLVHLRGVRRSQVRRVTVYVNGVRQRVLRLARRVVRVTLTGRSRGAVRVRLVVRTRSGRTRVDRRTYRACAPRRG